MSASKALVLLADVRIDMDIFLPKALTIVSFYSAKGDIGYDVFRFCYLLLFSDIIILQNRNKRKCFLWEEGIFLPSYYTYEEVAQR